MIPPIPADWKSLLAEETKASYYGQLDSFLDEETAQGKMVLPKRDEIFNALSMTPYEKVKVLLLGQDPYPNPSYAHGLCFSVRPEVRSLPQSLRNIYKELHADVGFRMPNNGYLESWARQGILLLNTVLTVRAGEANSHQGKGWELFTDRIIELVNAKPKRVVFVLWGARAQKKLALIQQAHHAIVQSAHPSPLSARKFFGCRCFSLVNKYLAEAGEDPIDWQIPDV